MRRVLDLFWWLSVLTVGAMSLLLLWSLVGEISLPIELDGLRGFSIKPGGHFSLVLPVALQGPATDLSGIRADFRFPSLTGGFVPISISFLIVLMMLVAWMLDQLRKVLKTVMLRDPFAVENARRIALIGVAVVAFEVVHALAIAYWSYMASDLLTASGSPFTAASRISAPRILYGFLFMALAAAFREGTRLREEQSLTI
jgi:hypothetical protein